MIALSIKCQEPVLISTPAKRREGMVIVTYCTDFVCQNLNFCYYTFIVPDISVPLTRSKRRNITENMASKTICIVWSNPTHARLSSI